MARDTETLAALTYSMANRCEAIIAADGGCKKYQIVFGYKPLTLEIINPMYEFLFSTLYFYSQPINFYSQQTK